MLQNWPGLHNAKCCLGAENLDSSVCNDTQACGAAEDSIKDTADTSDQDHMWDFLKDGMNMLIRSATLQVRQPLLPAEVSVHILGLRPL